MKRITCLLLGFLLLVATAGCGHSEKKANLSQYIEVDLAELGELESKLLDSYQSVTGENYTSDYITYTELSETTIVLARELNDQTLDLSLKINDDEILATHRLYMSFTNKFLSALGMMITAIENQDYSQVSEANEKINEANNYALDYKLALNDLIKKYNYK